MVTVQGHDWLEEHRNQEAGKEDQWDCWSTLWGFQSVSWGGKHPWVWRKPAQGCPNCGWREA